MKNCPLPESEFHSPLQPGKLHNYIRHKYLYHPYVHLSGNHLLIKTPYSIRLLQYGHIHEIINFREYLLHKQTHYLRLLHLQYTLLWFHQYHLWKYHFLWYKFSYKILLRNSLLILASNIHKHYYNLLHLP